jgi:hypothetical protein
MRIGIGAYDLTCGDLVNLAVAAEEFGFDALWLSEHTVLPVGYRSEHAGHHEPGNDVSTHIKEAIVDESTRLLDLWVSMAAIAASTSHSTLHVRHARFRSSPAAGSRSALVRVGCAKSSRRWRYRSTLANVCSMSVRR